MLILLDVCTLFKLVALGIDLDCVHLYLLIIHFIIFLLFNLTLAEFISSLHADALLHLHHVLLWNLLWLEIITLVILVLWKTRQTLSANHVKICVLGQLALGLVPVFKMSILWCENIFWFLRRCLRSYLDLTFRMRYCLLLARLSCLSHRNFLDLKLRIGIVLPRLLLHSIRLFLRIWQKLSNIRLNRGTCYTKSPIIMHTKLLFFGLSLSKIVLVDLIKSIVDIAICSIHILHLFLINGLHVSLQCDCTTWSLFKTNSSSFLNWDRDSCTCWSFRQSDLILANDLTLFWVIYVNLAFVTDVIMRQVISLNTISTLLVNLHLIGLNYISNVLILCILLIIIILIELIEIVVREITNHVSLLNLLVLYESCGIWLDDIVLKSVCIWELLVLDFAV